MAYEFYLDGVLLPVTPSKLKVKVKSKNKTTEMLSGGDMNIIKAPGLKEISFDALFPMRKYAFANYTDGFRNAEYYVNKLAALKKVKAPFRFIVVRMSQNGTRLDFDSNYLTTLEDYTLTEDASDGGDVTASITLKEYVEYKTKTIVVKKSRDQRVREAYAARPEEEKEAVAKAYAETIRPISDANTVSNTRSASSGTRSDILNENGWEVFEITNNNQLKIDSYESLAMHLYGAKYTTAPLVDMLKKENGHTLIEIAPGDKVRKAFAVGTKFKVPTRKAVQNLFINDFGSGSTDLTINNVNGNVTRFQSGT